MRKELKVKKTFWFLTGWISFALGTIGAVLPIIPTFPFFLLASYSFAKSSEKLHSWFVSTKIYKKNFETYSRGEGMTWATKARIMALVTIFMALGFCMMLMKGIYIPCMILAVVWIAHIIYFCFVVKTYKRV